MKIAIVGQGLFGSIIRDALLKDGHEVMVCDANKPFNGSTPAACLMKPGWLNKVPRLQEVFELLDELYGVEEIEFNINGLLNQKVLWVNPRKVLKPIAQFTEAITVGGKSVGTKDKFTFNFDHVIVAAGVWTKELCPWVPVEPRWGAAFLWREHVNSVIPPFISQWAPYKQVVAFQRGDGLWAGDGSALKTLDPEREQQILERCQAKLDIHDRPLTLKGQRPYVKHNTPGDPCWLEFRDDGLIVATGGAKNGTAAAGYCALKIRERLRGHS